MKNYIMMCIFAAKTIAFIEVCIAIATDERTINQKVEGCQDARSMSLLPIIGSV